jgi:hypothetical protein
VSERCHPAAHKYECDQDGDFYNYDEAEGAEHAAKVTLALKGTVSIG